MRVEPVDSLADPRVADYRNVRDAHLRDASGLFLVEGRLGVERLLGGSRYPARSVFVTQTALGALRHVLEPLSEETPVYVASRRVLCEVVGYDMHRGCLAAAERATPPALDELLARCADGPARLVLLEDVTNPDNVGGILRTAHALGAAGVLLTRGCADPLYRKSIRVSMGASLRLPWLWLDDPTSAARRLREAGFHVVALAAPSGERANETDAVPLSAYGTERPRPERVALLLGTEGAGLTPAALAAADERVAIPMAPGVDSLNVATACGIALHWFGCGRAPLA